MSRSTGPRMVIYGSSQRRHPHQSGSHRSRGSHAHVRFLRVRSANPYSIVARRWASCESSCHGYLQRWSHLHRRVTHRQQPRQMPPRSAKPMMQQTNEPLAASMGGGDASRQPVLSPTKRARRIASPHRTRMPPEERHTMALMTWRPDQGSKCSQQATSFPWSPTSIPPSG